MRIFLKTRHNAFSMIELVIVIVIIGIIAAIAIPRMSRGTAGAQTGALTANLTILRNAIELYRAEHDGRLPDADIAHQLTQFSDSLGSTQATKDAAHPFGPYVSQIPPLPGGDRKGSNGVFVETLSTNTTPPGGLDTDGWWYNSALGVIRANVDGAAVNQNDVGRTFKSF